MENETCRDAVQKHVQKQVSQLAQRQMNPGLTPVCFRFGEINVLVNNAGKQSMCKNFQEIDLDMVESIFRSNILAMLAITKYAIPHMKKGSSIINTTSTVAFR